MYDIVRQFAEQLSHEEKVRLLRDLKAAIAEELSPEKGEPEACPRCGCPEFTKKGHARGGAQRWLCKGCGSTFQASTRGLLAASKLGPAVWMEFAECMADCLSLRDSAERCHVALSTAWFMRHRVCEVMEGRLGTFRPCSRCQVDGTYFAENLSGNHARSSTFEMPRKPHKNGKGVRKRGISNEQVCVLTGINEFGDVFAGLSCRGRETIEDVKAALAGRVGAGSAVETDMHPSYPRAMAALGVASHVTVDPKDRSAGDINMVNAMHSRLDGFLSGFHGVATRRLQHYLDWFCYREQFKGCDGDRREILYSHEAEGSYTTTRREYALTPHPFMEYWGQVNSGLT